MNFKNHVKGHWVSSLCCFARILPKAEKLKFSPHHNDKSKLSASLQVSRTDDLFDNHFVIQDAEKASPNERPGKDC